MWPQWWRLSGGPVEHWGIGQWLALLFRAPLETSGYCCQILLGVYIHPCQHTLTFNDINYPITMSTMQERWGRTGWLEGYRRVGVSTMGPYHPPISLGSPLPSLKFVICDPCAASPPLWSTMIHCDPPNPGISHSPPASRRPPSSSHPYNSFHPKGWNQAFPNTCLKVSKIYFGI